MRVLITGINGFIGTWLSRALQPEKYNLYGLARQPILKKTLGYQQFTTDILEAKKITAIVNQIKPDIIFHLAAQSNIPYSFTHPQETLDINLKGTLNLLEAVKMLDKKTIFISVGSSSEYGYTALHTHYLSEEAPLSPSSPYAISKAAQGYLTNLYHRVYGIKSIHVRPFAIIGPAKKKDAISDFARGITAIERGLKKFLEVGDLSHTRDFLDVRDAVSALILIAKKGLPGSVYNICSGQRIKLKNILEIMLSLSQAKIDIKINFKKKRPSDDPTIIGNPEKLFTLGFKPSVKLKKTLKDTLDYWRNKL